MRTLAVAALALVLPSIALAQAGGRITGRVTDVLNAQPVPNAVVTVGSGVRGSVTGADGRYAIRDLAPGYYRLRVRAAGFRVLARDSVFVGTGRTTIIDLGLTSEAVPLPPLAVEAAPDRLLDPREPQTVQPIAAEDLRVLPVSTLDEAVALQTGVVLGSFRGGRLGQDILVVDGFGLKNQLDASSGRLGLRFPTAALQEATVVTGGFSAGYGQALSGIVTASTRDGGDRLEGRVTVETDRPLPEGWDVGLDRLTVSAAGPVVGPLRFLAVVDAEARIDDDPVNAPPPSDTLDPRSARPWVLPRNAGERYDVLGKLTLPVGRRNTVRLLGMASESQRRLYDPQLKYAPGSDVGERLHGRFALLHLRHVTPPTAATTIVADVRVGMFEKEAVRGPVADPAGYRLGGFTFSRLALVGERLASSQDTVAARAPIAGFERPTFVEGSPWGVPAFFLTAPPRGELVWNRFREGRLRVDLLVGPGQDTDLRAGGEYVRQRVQTFTRLEAYRSVADGAPPATGSDFGPRLGAGYVELQQRTGEFTLTAGMRLDLFNGRSATDAVENDTKLAIGPRLALSTVLGPATVVVGWGRFAQPPDFQYLVDAAFDDTLRTGRFRRGNSNLGFETSTQYELQVRARPTTGVSLRIGTFVKRLDGLVASIPLGLDPDSAIFASGDFGNVKGIETTLEREFDGLVGGRVTYVLQQAQATATDARDFYRRLRISPIGDTIVPATAQFPLDFDRRHTVTVVGRGRVPASAGRLIGGTEGTVVGRWGSGLPFTRTTAAGDSIIGLPNSGRLPLEFSLDVLLRREVGLGAVRVAAFVDVRNLTNRRNVVAVRRDNGLTTATDTQIDDLAERAYQAHPSPIPYESPRYRPWADLDGDGVVAGRDELLPLYLRAARDIAQPVFLFGPPRLVRIGVEIAF